MNEKVFKIRDRVTGLYSTGGMVPFFTKFGKSWSSVGALRAHLTLVRSHHDVLKTRAHFAFNYDPSTHEIVEFNVVESSTIKL